MGCAAAVAFTAGRAAAMEPPPVPAPEGSMSPLTSAGGPGGAPPAPPGGPGGAAAAHPPADAASVPAPPAPPAGYAASPPVPPPPPAGAWSVAPPGYPPPPPGWVWSPVPTRAPGGAQPTPKTVWYGWQHMLVFLGSLVLLPIGADGDSEGLVWLSISGFALGGPVTHWANGNLGKGFISLGLNAGCTLGGGMVGMLVGAASDDPFAALGGLVFGGGLGLLTANIIDIAVLEYEEREAAERYDYLRVRSPRLRLAPQVGLVPQAGVAPGGATFGLTGAF
ncbi:hypothetical protein [Sorangium sp. So ce1024]|uniref:hypothetical protein n=1 Tax=Sorangium sp. So ce1024 TaxID=3133327 RepID=UPI003F026BE2